MQLNNFCCIPLFKEKRDMSPHCLKGKLMRTESYFPLHSRAHSQAHAHRKAFPPDITECLRCNTMSHDSQPGLDVLSIVRQLSLCDQGFAELQHFPRSQASTRFSLYTSAPLTSISLAHIPASSMSLLLQGPLYWRVTVTRAYLPFSLVSCLILLIWTVHCLKYNIQQP